MRGGHLSLLQAAGKLAFNQKVNKSHGDHLGGCKSMDLLWVIEWCWVTVLVVGELLNSTATFVPRNWWVGHRELWVLGAHITLGDGVTVDASPSPFRLCRLLTHKASKPWPSPGGFSCMARVLFFSLIMRWAGQMHMHGSMLYEAYQKEDAYLSWSCRGSQQFERWYVMLQNDGLSWTASYLGRWFNLPRYFFYVDAMY